MAQTDGDQPRVAGMAALRAGRLAEARTLLDRAVTEHPDDAAALLGQGIVLARQGELEAALAALEKAAGLRPDEPSIQFNLGIARQQAGQVAPARAAFEAVLRVAPDHAKARAALAALPSVESPADDGPALASLPWEQAPPPRVPVVEEEDREQEYERLRAEYRSSKDDEDEAVDTRMPTRAYVMAAVYGWLVMSVHCGLAAFYVSAMNGLTLGLFALGLLAVESMVIGPIMGLVIAMCDASEEAGRVIGALTCAAFAYYWLAVALGLPAVAVVKPVVFGGIYGWGVGQAIARAVGTIEA